MSPRARRLLAAAVAAAVLVPAASAGGVTESALPAAAVVRVGDALIGRATFRHWLGIAGRSDPANKGVVYRPPDFVSCVKLKRETERGTSARLKTRCKGEYEALRDQVLQFLILEKWVAGESAARGVAPSTAEIDNAFDKAKRSSFRTETDFRRFLRQSGMTLADARFQVAFNTRYTMLRQLAITTAAPVTDTEAAAYYADNSERFAEPEMRDVLMILTKTRAKANAARAALDRGQTFRRVAPMYSIDRNSVRRGGLVRGVVEGLYGRTLDKALFRAPQGKLRGPIKTWSGYYLFKVLKITRAKQQTLAEARPSIREELTAERQRDADDTFTGDLKATWRPRTTCRKGYVMAQCGNAPSAASDDSPSR